MCFNPRGYYQKIYLFIHSWNASKEYQLTIVSCATTANSFQTICREYTFMTRTIKVKSGVIFADLYLSRILQYCVCIPNSLFYYQNHLGTYANYFIYLLSAKRCKLFIKFSRANLQLCNCKQTQKVQCQTETKK